MKSSTENLIFQKDRFSRFPNTMKKNLISAITEETMLMYLLTSRVNYFLKKLVISTNLTKFESAPDNTKEYSKIKDLIIRSP